MNISTGNYFIQWRRQICNPENNRFVNNFVVYLNSSTYMKIDIKILLLSLLLLLLSLLLLLLLLLFWRVTRQGHFRYGTKIF